MLCVLTDVSFRLAFISVSLHENLTSPYPRTGVSVCRNNSFVRLIVNKGPLVLKLNIPPHGFRTTVFLSSVRFVDRYWPVGVTQILHVPLCRVILSKVLGISETYQNPKIVLVPPSISCASAAEISPDDDEGAPMEYRMELSRHDICMYLAFRVSEHSGEQNYSEGRDFLGY
ncbi:uncharacterized protein BT62DRAFT_1014074 [Guyanagaster necrorhizus]|uniref:Uncharacterized protein n=1 Tax=Guyanagaster necrorhizus TaxID=856835 RepID=A0A9P7VG22_9AGAR|nr:uncharacterized protein BT62DRAFT_1014074 [Guyanagaster necrorhizus MCA 3950]KAG7439334.1 hypothetical protein BT62DRAFT_1014074 [Guyanagaster necrorhizus MCA 3950]